MSHIIVAGPIGVGKTTAVTLVAPDLGYASVTESFEDNPYLEAFYSDMEMWAFHLQVAFFSSQLRQDYEARSLRYVLQERSLYEVVEVFSRHHYRNGLMSRDEWETIQRLYRGTLPSLSPPDLVIHLTASPAILLDRIAQRDRVFERSITAAYLQGLIEAYDEWAAEFSLCPVYSLNTTELSVQNTVMAIVNIVQGATGY